MMEIYWDYKYREEIKSKAWSKLSQEKNPRKRCLIFLHEIILAHYWRCREGLEDRRDYKTFLRKIRGKDYYPEYRLDIDHYTENWLFSNKHCVDDETYLELCNFYQPKSNKYMKEGQTSYYCTEKE